ncbi:MAG: ABC transporter substrate-binding protein [Flavobacteriales bacterium]
MITVIDGVGKKVELARPARRIVSTVPSQSEYLFDLGLENEVIGITKFCIYPKSWFESKQKIGGTKNLHLEKIAALNPDLIIANKEENTLSDIEWLAERFPIYISDINTLKEAYQSMSDIGMLTNREVEAQNWLNRIQDEQRVYNAVDQEFGTVAYLIWNDPLMAVGSNNFIHDMLGIGGWDNCFSHLKRYPVITIDDIIAEAPHLLFLSSEPFPFKQSHVSYFKEHLPQTEVLIVDGEMFSWYGSRLLKSFKYFDKLREKAF